MINAPEEYKDKAWQRLLKQKLDFPSLAKIIKEAPKVYKDKIWQAVLKHKPCYATFARDFISKHANIPIEYRIEGWKNLVKEWDEFDIRFIVDLNYLTEKFWEELLKQKLNTDEMYEIIRCAPEKHKKEAWERFLKLEAYDCKPCLIMMCRHSLTSSHSIGFPENYKIKVWEEFLKRKPGNDELFLVIKKAPEKYYRTRAWEELRKGTFIPNDICIKILNRGAPKYKYDSYGVKEILSRGIPIKYKDEVWAQFLKQNPSNYELFLVIEKASEECYKLKAWDKFLEQNPDSNDLNLVITFAPEEYSKKAQEVLNKVLKKEIYI
ncbi:MAG: hypothetical protein ACKKMR_02640 [Candidatus Nealsonbacteria bacterium]